MVQNSTLFLASLLFHYWPYYCTKITQLHTDKWYSHKVESVLDNKTHKILSDFRIQMNQPILAIRPDQTRRKKCHLVDFAIPVNHRLKIREKQKTDKCLDFARESWKSCTHSNSNCSWNGLQRPGKDKRRIED